MSPQSAHQKKVARTDRWITSLSDLAASRGNSASVGRRAVELTRQFNISPWIALAIAERLITLEEARVLDRVGRCKELQSAILDKQRPLDELKTLLPYAAHFLAADLADAYPARHWDSRLLIRILEGILGAERAANGDEVSLRVRTRSLPEYEAVVEHILAIMKRTRCDASMALDVDAGRITEQFALDYMRQKRVLEMEERRASEAMDGEKARFPSRRNEPGNVSRRSMYHTPDAGRNTTGSVPDHWPKENPHQAGRDHWSRESAAHPVRDHWPK